MTIINVPKPTKKPPVKDHANSGMEEFKTVTVKDFKENTTQNIKSRLGATNNTANFQNFRYDKFLCT